MLFRAQVRGTAQSLLAAAVLQSGATVETSKDQPIQAGKGVSPPPTIIVYTDDNKRGIPGSTPPQFQTTVLTTVEIVVEAVSKEEAEALCDALCELVENTLLGTPEFVRLFEGIDRVETRPDYKGDGARKHTFIAVIEIEAHTSEIFEPTITTPLGGLNIYVDSVNVFDAAGTYEPPFNYPVAAAPRAAGPDGRLEIAASLDLPQE